MKIRKSDYVNWLLRPFWTLEEGLLLLSGIEPFFNVSKYLVHRRDKLSQELIPRMDIGGRAIKHRTLLVEGEYHSARWACELNPTTFLKWAESNDWKIPDELTGLLNTPEPVKFKLDTRERNSLLQIIAVLAKEAKLDLTKHSKAAEILQEMGASHGLELPKKKDTIANKLREARDLKETR